MTVLCLMLFFGMLAGPLSGQDRSDRAVVSAALRVVSDSLVPWNARNGVRRTVVRFYVDAERSGAAQQRAAPTVRLSNTQLIEAVHLVSSPGKQWAIKGSADFVECKPGSRRDCRMDPSIAVVTVGAIERLSESEVRLHVGTKQMGPSDWGLYFVSHRLVFAWRDGSWHLAEYSQPEVS